MLTRVSCDCDGYEKAAGSGQPAAGSDRTGDRSRKSEVGGRKTEDRFFCGCSFPRPPRLSAPQADDGWQAAAIMKDKAGS